MLVSGHTKKYIYDRSEEFRAQIFFLLGSVLGTPFCLEIANDLQNRKYPDAFPTFIEFGLFIGAYLLVAESYGIMKRRDEKNARAHG